MKTKNWFIFLLSAIIVVGITLGIFSLLGPEEKTHSFYINMAVCCILELILLSNLPFLGNERLMTIRNLSISVQAYYFVLLEGFWMLFYNGVLSDSMAETYYYSGLLIILLIFVVLIGTVGIGGNIQKENQEVIEQSVSARKVHLASTHLILLEYRQIMQNVDSSEKERQEQLLKILLDRIGAIPAEKLERNFSVAEEINSKLVKLIELFLVEESDNEKSMSLLTKEIESFMNYITCIKNKL